MAEQDGRENKRCEQRARGEQRMDGMGSDNKHKTTEVISDKTLWTISQKVGEWEELALNLGFEDAGIVNIKRDHLGDNVHQIYTMLSEWRRKQPSSVNQTDALCTALEVEEVGRMDLSLTLRGLVRAQHQSDQQSADNRPSTSHEPTIQDAVAQTSECSSPKEIRINSPAEDASDSCEEELKAHYKSTGSYVQMIPWVDDDKKHIMDIYTKLQLVTEEHQGTYAHKGKGFKTKDLKSYEDIFSIVTREGDAIMRAILSGLAGRGKSTLFDKMAYDWAVDSSKALQKYKVVVLLKMHALKQSSDLIDAVFYQLLGEDTSIEKGALESFINNSPDKVLVLLDGFDELMTTSLCKSSFGSILKILNRQKCRGCCVLVTTRPSHFDKLVTKQLVQNPFTHVKVLGFSAEDIKEYVYKFYSDEHEEAKRLCGRIQSSDILSNLAESPMLLLLMCLLWRGDSTLPNTVSRLYSDAVNYIFKRKADMSEDEISKVVIDIGKIGLRGLLCPDQVLSFKETEFEMSVIDIALKAGLLTRQRVLRSLNTHNSIQFFHKTFQEFCAAKYLQSLLKADMEEFQKILNRVSKNPLGFEYLLRFCSGDNEECTNKILQMFQERRQKNLSFDDSQGQLALHCYFECQSRTLPPEEFIHSFLTDDIVLFYPNSDCLYSFTYFLKHVADQTRDRGNVYLAKVQKLEIAEVVSKTFCEDLEHCISAMTNLQTLTLLHNLSDNTSSKSAIDLTEDRYNKALVSSMALWSRHLKLLQNLNLSGCLLTGEDMTHIAESLSDLPNLVKLDLSSNEHLGGTAACWSHHLMRMNQLQKLTLGDCSWTGEDMTHIAESLSGLPNLVELDLSDNESLQGTAALWSCYLKRMRRLQKLTLIGCSLTGEDMTHIAESLSDLPNFVDCDLSQNEPLGGTSELWLHHLKQMNHLQKLALGECSWTGEDMTHIAESPSDLPSLVELDLSRNEPLGGTSALWSHRLKHIEHIQKLNLSGCLFTGEDMTHIAESLSDLPSLVEFDLSSNEPLGSTAALWSSHLKRMNHLQKLNLSGCLFTGEDITSVAGSLKDLPNFVELNLSYNKHLGGRAAVWSNQLKHTEHLQKLNLCCCSLTVKDMTHIAESLSDLPKLTELDVSFNWYLSGTAALWSDQLRHLMHLQYLNLKLCSLTEEDKKQIAKSLNHLSQKNGLAILMND